MRKLNPKKLAIQKYSRGNFLDSKPNKPPRHRSGQKFLKGPIPLSWLCSAALLPGKTLAVSMALWFKAGVTETDTVRFTKSLRSQFNVGPKSASRCLKLLEEAKLVAVKRGSGRCPVVTILDVSGKDHVN